jgi:hypothetical protein
MVRTQQDQEWGLSKPKTPVIGIGSRSKYAPLTIPHSGDVNEVVAEYDTTTFPETPDQFMLVLGDDVMRLVLKPSGDASGELMLMLGADALDDLVNIASREAGVEPPEDGCRDVVIRYRVFGREFGGTWREYLHGPLTFECRDDEGEGEDDGEGEGGNNVSPSDGHGPFDSNYAPAFE